MAAIYTITPLEIWRRENWTEHQALWKGYNAQRLVAEQEPVCFDSFRGDLWNGKINRGKIVL